MKKNTLPTEKVLISLKEARLKRWKIISLILMVLFIAADQISKSLIDSYMSAEESITVIKNFFYIGKTYNKGAAFSIFAASDTAIYFLASLSVIAGFLFIFFSLRSEKVIGSYIFAMLAAGTIGNGIDRILHGYVIDFAELHFSSYIFPSFNLADAVLTVHITVLLVVLIFGIYSPEKDLFTRKSKSEEL